MKDNTKIHLTKVQETLLLTLHAKASDYHSKESILNDEQADQILDKIDYDFGKLKSFGNGNVLVVRPKQYDEWLRDFLRAKPKAIVLNLGCGLDMRITRIHPSEGISWFDIDYPEVIQLRENFYSDRKGYAMIGSSITDPEWLTEIPRDRPALIVAEGVLEYLTEADVKALLNRITDHFPHGQLVFDVMNSSAIATNALCQWGVDDLDEVDKLDTKLKRMTELPLFKSPYFQKLPWEFRSFYNLMSLVPRYRNMMRLLRYQF
jgi:O-methyltransferase involved in polyketide biosynthesis